MKSKASNRNKYQAIEPLEARYAPAAFTGSVAGVFTNADGGTVTGEGTENFTWGEGINGSGPNRFTFTPASINAQPGEVFSLGSLTYTNGTTRTGTEANTVNLSISLDMDRPVRGGVKDVSYGLSMHSTTNTDDPVASADYVNLGSGTHLNVKLGNKTYTLEILGFGSLNGGQPQVEKSFHVQEGSGDSAQLLARFTPLDLIAKSVNWDPNNGGLKVKYQVKGIEAPGVPVSLYWASGSDPIREIDLSPIEFQTAVGSHVINISGALLQRAPEGATHIVMAMDGDEQFAEVNEDNNRKSVKDVELVRGPKATGVLSDYTVAVIKDLLRQSGEASATISSLQRTPEDQARIMFDNIMKHSAQQQKNLYAAAGDAVIDVWVAETDGLTRSEIRANRASIESAMVAKINELGPSNVSHHCGDPNVLQVLDLAPSSFSAGSKAIFRQLAPLAVEKFLDPSKFDPAFHLAIRQ